MVIIDTGFFIALADPNDRYHPAVCELRKEIREPLVTTWAVLTEAAHLLLSRRGPAAVAALMQSMLDGAFRLHNLSALSCQRFPELIKKYADLPMDLTDASLVVLAEELGDGRIISTDRRDFKTYRWKDRKPFNNLLKL